MNYITYLAHGNIGYINECRFSLLKFLQVYNLYPPADLGVIIYTDQPQAFENFIPFFKSFHLEPINQSILTTWIEGTNYVHRAKTKMIQDALTKHPGNLIFFDTDTYVTGPIEDMWSDIDQGIVYMHLKEGIIDRKVNKYFYKWDRFLERASIRYGTKSFVYDKNFAIWNSGVMGLSVNHLPVLDDVLLLIDSIHQQFPKHITEQVAVSYCFGEAYTIKASECKVAHYWNLKEFRHLLTTFFARNLEESIPNLVKKAHHIDALSMMQQKHAFKQLPSLQRLFKSITGSAWNISRYEKKL
ncbi:MAG TPA: hypothetical protein VEB42_17395 [Chitinophagaceae bacterium]|nr:hypothetical protein [Chitinophagaceae bacterium]